MGGPLRKPAVVALALSLAGIATAQERGTLAPPPCHASRLPEDSLRAIGIRLHPEVLTDNRQAGLLVGLLFDANCRIVAHSTMRQPAEPTATFVAMEHMMPELRGKSMVVSGFIFVGQPRYGGSGIVWGVLRDSAGR